MNNLPVFSLSFHCLLASDVVLEARPWPSGQIFMAFPLALASGPKAMALKVQALALKVQALALACRAEESLKILALTISLLHAFPDICLTTF